MRILAINCGSSSIKSALIDTASGARLFRSRVTGIGEPAAVLRVDGVDRALPACRDIGAAAWAVLEEVRGRLRGGCGHRGRRASHRSRRGTLSYPDAGGRRRDRGAREPRPPGAAAQSAGAGGAATRARGLSRRPARRGVRYRVPQHLAAGGRASTRCPKPSAPATAPAGTAFTVSATRT